MKRNNLAVIFLAVILVFCGIRTAGALGIREAISFLSSDNPIQFTATAEIGKMPQFDENRISQLNRLIRHFSFQGILDGRKSGVSVLLDGEELFSVSEQESGNMLLKMYFSGSEHKAVFPNGNDITEANRNIFLNAFKGASEQNNLWNMLRIYSSLFERMPEYFRDYGGTAKILEKYKDYGTAVNRLRLKIPAEELTQFIHENEDIFPKNRCTPDLRKIIFSGRQDFELLLTEEGRILKLRYGGTAGYSYDDMRTVRLEWKTVRNESTEKDELSLRTPDSTATRRNNIILEHLWKKTEDGKEEFSWKVEKDILADRIRNRETILCHAETEEGKLSGIFSETSNVKGETDGKEILFEVSGDPSDRWVGTLEIISKKDKIESGRLKAEFGLKSDTAEPAGDFSPEKGDSAEKDYSAAGSEIISAIVSRLVKLPAEDLVFLTEGIPEETVKSIFPDYESIKEPLK